jgi:hypothetical protein
MAKLSQSLRGSLRLFAFYLANGTIDWDILGDEWDYAGIFSEPSELEQVFAIWGNLVEVDEHGQLSDDQYAQRRAAQYIRHFIDPTYVVDPPFEARELELHL